ncbi:MAG: FAD-dependent oxidoreductase [Mycobacterium leprae]
MNRATLTQLTDGTFDLLVIGGGITGCGVAREAALRGLRVALVEANDFAYGTSSRSTKLIHGGLRYLKNMDFRLVREAVQERMWMLQAAPHLVKATSFLFPVYQGDPDPLWMLRIGLTMYDWFAGKGNPIPHKVYRPAALRGQESGLRSEGLIGGAEYLDASTDDCRLTYEVAESAARYGALLANYTEATGFVRDQRGMVTGATVKDRLSGESVAVKAKQVLACGGPWADRIRRMDDPNAPELLRVTKGVHLTVLAERLPIQHAVVMRGPDGRMMFAVPSGAFTYVGTTDTDYEGDPGQIGTDRSDVTYILAATNKLFPGANLTEEDVISNWAGLRPLVRPKNSRSTSATSRDYTLNRGTSGLVTIAGGKLTAFRHMAEHIVDELFPTTGGGRHRTASRSPLPGAAGAMTREEEIARLAAATGATPAAVARLAERYGSLFPRVIAELPPVSPERTPEHLWLTAQMRSAVRHEMAMHLTDVLARRTEAMLFSVGNGRAYVDSLAAEMGALLNWSPERVATEAGACHALINEMFRWQAGVPRTRMVNG